MLIKVNCFNRQNIFLLNFKIDYIIVLLVKISLISKKLLLNQGKIKFIQYNLDFKLKINN